MTDTNMDMMGMELSDDQLEEVNGGATIERSDGKFYCPYCHTYHHMWKWSPVSPIIASHSYPGSTKFQCDTHGYFYQVIMDGEQVYLAGTGKRLF